MVVLFDYLVSRKIEFEVRNYDSNGNYKFTIYGINWWIIVSWEDFKIKVDQYTHQSGELTSTMTLSFEEFKEAMDRVVDSDFKVSMEWAITKEVSWESLKDIFNNFENGPYSITIEPDRKVKVYQGNVLLLESKLV